MAEEVAVQITFRKSALRRWRDLTPAQAKKVRKVLDNVAADRRFRHNNLKPLKSVKNGVRFQLGDWRICFTLDREAGILDVFEVGPRGSAYR